MIKIEARLLSRPLRNVFRIARGVKTSAKCLIVELRMDGHMGRGEAVPYARYGETTDDALASLEGLGAIGLEDDPRDLLEAGAARNALDCALWDLRAKINGTSVANLLNMRIADQLETAQTLSLDTPENMANSANALSKNALIKIKLGGTGDLARLKAIRAVRPLARLIVDANEGWSVADYEGLIPALIELKVEMIEQPFPASDDALLAKIERPIPICADESAHLARDVERLVDRYDMINIKLDKSGGLSEALAMVQMAKEREMPYMIGCMVGSSLAMAPAYMLGLGARYVDLDGPLFLSEDEAPAIVYENGMMYAPSRDLWG